MMTSANSSDNSNYPTFFDSTPLEASAPLETSASLDTDKTALVSAPSLSPPQPLTDRDRGSQSMPPMELSSAASDDRKEKLFLRQSQPPIAPESGEVIQLLEERLVIDRKRVKIGEVIVRKEIETRMIEVPVRREKLIIEQVGSEMKQLATIDLGESVLNRDETESPISQPTISGEFMSIKAAMQFLETIAATQTELESHAVQIKILVENAEHRQLNQQWLDRQFNDSI